QRPAASLWWSGVAAGVCISVSPLAEGALHHYLPDVPWQHVVTSFGYCFGFLIVVLGRLQLFTETTITAVLPLLAHWSTSTVKRTARLWGIVLAANLAGTFATAVLMTQVGLMPEAHLAAALEVAGGLLHLDWLQAALYGIPAGFLVAAITWMLPKSEGSEFWVIVTLTYLIGVGGFTHVIAGSTEIFMLIMAGELGLGRALGGLLLPILVGNVIGGTGLFALLAYGQVREEIEEE
ncbi:MAG: formate/nitrite transporter family protein, partial [Anaerolineae bacterium]